MHIDLTDLRLFVAIAESSSLTKGAQRNHLSVPAVSLRVKNLEEGIGARLLYRSSQGVTLTPAGQSLLGHARLVLEQLEGLRGALQEFGRGVKGHLRLYASATAMELLPNLLRDYLCAHPDVNVDLKERMSDEIVRAVTEGQTDIGIVTGTEKTQGLEVFPYQDDRLVLVVPPAHEFCRLAAVAFEETLDHDQVSLVEGSAIHTFVRLRAQELKRTVNLRIQVGSFEASARMIEAGVGIGVMPESAARRHAERMNLRIVELSDPWALRRQYVCVRSLALLPVFARDLVLMLHRRAIQGSSGPRNSDGSAGAKSRDVVH